MSGPKKQSAVSKKHQESEPVGTGSAHPTEPTARANDTAQEDVVAALTDAVLEEALQSVSAGTQRDTKPPSSTAPSSSGSAPAAAATVAPEAPAPSDSFLSTLPPALRSALAERAAVYNGTAPTAPSTVTTERPEPTPRAAGGEPTSRARAAAANDAIIDKALSALDAFSRAFNTEPAAEAATGARETELAAERDQLRAAVEQLERDREEWTRERDALSERCTQLEQACAERGERVATLEAELREAIAKAQAAPATDPNGETAAVRLAEMEAKYLALVTTFDKERRTHANEIANLTKQLSQLRQRPAGPPPEAPHDPPIRSPRPLENPTPIRNEPIHFDADPPPQRPGAAARSEAPSIGAEPLPQRPPTLPSSQVPSLDKAGAVDVGPAELVIVDDSEIGEEAARPLSRFGFPVATIPPNAELAERLAERTVAMLAINLAMPTTWRAIRTLAGTHALAETPMVAYALPQRTTTGFWFGGVRFLTLPVDDATLIETLRRLAPGVRQTIVIGSDSTVVAVVRQQLNKARVQVVTASDRRQALESLRGLTPQAIVVHPAASPVDAFRALAAIRGNWTFKDIPSLFLLDNAPPAREEELISAGVRTILRLGNLDVDELTNLVSSAMTGLRSPLRVGARR